jgi:replicative DNA helicase
MTQVPPHDLEAEAAVLSAIMIGGETGFSSPIAQVADTLAPEHFYSEAHRQIYAAMLAVREAGRPVDNVTILTWLRDRSRLEQIGGPGYLSEVMNAAPAIANIRPYAKTVIEKARVRKLIATCQRIAALGYLDYGDAEKFIEGAEAEIRELAVAHIEREGEMLHVAIERVMRESVAMAQSSGHMRGVPTGFEGLDKRMHGLREGTVTIIAARPGMGKSALALNMAINMAKSTGGVVPFFSLEMSNDEQAVRTISSDTSIPIGAITGNNLPADGFSRMITTATAMKGVGVKLYDESNMTTGQLNGKLRRLIEDVSRAGKKVVAVFIDYLQLMKSPRKTNAREQEVADVSRGLKLLAKELKLPFVVLAQLNRDGEKGAKPERPKLSHLRESGSIEQDADVVIFVHRAAYYDDKHKPTDNDLAELIIAKGRNIQRGTTVVKFDGMFTRFGREEVETER